MPGTTGMVPMVKRPAVADSKSGLPVYPTGSPATNPYLAGVGVQQYVPVSRAYTLIL